MTVLRISTDGQTDPTVTLSLEGKLDEAGAALLVQRCRELVAAGHSVDLDLRCLRYANTSGVDALITLRAEEVRLIGASPLIQGLLSLELSRSSRQH